MPKVRFCNYGTPPCIPQFGKNPWTATFIRKKSMNYHNSEKNYELPLKLRIWSLKVRIRSCKSKFGLLVAPNSKVLRSPNAVINFKFGQLVGFDPLANPANNGPNFEFEIRSDKYSEICRDRARFANRNRKHSVLGLPKPKTEPNWWAGQTDSDAGGTDCHNLVMVVIFCYQQSVLDNLVLIVIRMVVKIWLIVIVRTCLGTKNQY